MKRTFVLFISLTFFMGCHLYKEENKKHTDIPEDTNFNILWRTPVFDIGGNYKCVINDGVLYFTEAYVRGIGAVRLSDGEKLWEKTGIIRPKSQIIHHMNYLYIRDGADTDLQDPGGILVLDKLTGEKAGYIRPSILCFDYGDKAVQLTECWLKIYNNYLYFSINSRDVTVSPGIYRINLDSLVLDTEYETVAVPELMIMEEEKQRTSAEPLFEGNTAYFYIGGSGPLYVEGGHKLKEHCYTPEVVRMVSMELDGSVNWDIGFNNIGCVYGSNFLFIMNDDRLYVSDTSGVASINKNTGEIYYDLFVEEYDSGKIGPDYLLFHENRLYYNYNESIRSADALTGELLWKQESPWTIITNPVIYGDLVYAVYPDALKAFNKVSGELVYQNSTLGINGYRFAGYIPSQDGVIYIMDSQEIIAVELKPQ